LIFRSGICTSEKRTFLFFFSIPFSFTGLLSPRTSVIYTCLLFFFRTRSISGSLDGLFANPFFCKRISTTNLQDIPFFVKILLFLLLKCSFARFLSAAGFLFYGLGVRKVRSHLLTLGSPQICSFFPHKPFISGPVPLFTLILNLDPARRRFFISG